MSFSRKRRASSCLVQSSYWNAVSLMKTEDWSFILSKCVFLSFFFKEELLHVLLLQPPSNFRVTRKRGGDLNVMVSPSKQLLQPKRVQMCIFLNVLGGRLRNQSALRQVFCEREHQRWKADGLSYWTFFFLHYHSWLKIHLKELLLNVN